MNYIALQMLFEDKGKYFAMLAGVCFTSLIMTQQPAIFVGLMTRTYSFITDVAIADVWVMDPGVQFVEEHKPIRDTDLARVRGVQGVEWAAALYKNMVIGRLPDGDTRTLDLTGLDDATLVGAPQMLHGNLEDVRYPDGILVDWEAAHGRLQVKTEKGKRPLALGDVIELNDRRAVVIGFVKSRRNFVLHPQIYTLYSRALTYGTPYRKRLTYVLVKAKSGVDPKELARRISATTHLTAYTDEEFKKYTYDYWLKSTGIPINFGISVMLGFLVGTAITGQAFFNFVRENMQQYAALKAIGATNHMLTRMVLLQAAVVAFTGYGLGVGLSALFGWKVYDSVLAYQMKPVLLLFAGVGVLLITAFSVFLGIRRIHTVDPVTVFRG